MKRIPSSYSLRGVEINHLTMDKQLQLIGCARSICLLTGRFASVASAVQTCGNQRSELRLDSNSLQQTVRVFLRGRKPWLWQPSSQCPQVYLLIFRLCHPTLIINLCNAFCLWSKFFRRNISGGCKFANLINDVISSRPVFRPSLQLQVLRRLEKKDLHKAEAQELWSALFHMVPSVLPHEFKFLAALLLKVSHNKFWEGWRQKA